MQNAAGLSCYSSGTLDSWSKGPGAAAAWIFRRTGHRHLLFMFFMVLRSSQQYGFYLPNTSGCGHAGRDQPATGLF